MTTDEIIILITCLVGGALIVGTLVFYFLFQYPKDKERERLRRQCVEKEYEKQPEYQFRQATVIEKRKTAYYVGVNISKQVRECIVVFQTEEGETLTFQIRDELFDGIQENQKGMLVTVNGNFFYFGDGEDVAMGTAEQQEENLE